MAITFYGSQIAPMPGQANVGYGPGGQHYNMLNPVAMTTSGVRPLSVAVNRVTPANQAAAPIVSQQTQQMMANYRPPAWTDAGKRLATAEQLQYGSDLYGHPAATGGLAGSIVNGGAGGGAGGGATAGVSTGIGLNMPYQQLQRSQQSLWNPALNAPGLTMAQRGELGRQYNNILTPQIQRAGTELSRGAAEQFAALLRQGQVARANAGLGWANLGQRLNEISMDDILGQQGLDNDRLRLIASIIGGGL